MLAAARQAAQLGEGAEEEEVGGVEFKFVSFWALALGTGGGCGKALGTQRTLALIHLGCLKIAKVKPK